MITEEQMEGAVYARFPGSDIQSSACRGAWRYGANWAIKQTEEEVQALKNALAASEVFRKVSDRHFVEIVNENAELKAERDRLIDALTGLRNSISTWCNMYSYDGEPPAAWQKMLNEVENALK